jgi:lipid-binding SYLF domain-containing protein
MAHHGVLVVPNVKKVGLVGGGQWGEGAMRINDEDVAYYKMRSGSAGLQAGYEKGDMVLVLFTDEAIRKFQKGDLMVGAEAEVTMVDKEANASAETLKNKASIVGFAFGEKGLMAGVSLNGTKFKRIHPKSHQ